MHGMARAMVGSRGAHRGSISTWDARKPEKRMMTAASPRASEKEMINPARRVLPARSRSAAVKREMAVWMEPAQMEKQMP